MLRRRALIGIVCSLGTSMCRRSPAPAPLPHVPQTSGTLAVAGLQSPVRIVRDRAGVPHIYARSAADLFFAQGFVQAQDRLFQIDLWRRASQGRLAEVLGANFVDRDAMTRRIQYRGDLDEEWASYGPDARAIAEAFVAGINAWVSIARERLPDEFVQAHWPPAYWRAEDLLNRTDAFVSSGDALAEIRRAKLPDAVADGIRLVGTAPFLAGSSPPPALTATRTRTGAEASVGRVTMNESSTTLSAPAARYLVHLVAPGWNVVGATWPWLPGVAVGHNERIAWAMRPLAVDTRHVSVEPLSAVEAGAPQMLRIKGRPEMLPFTRDTTPRGLVVAFDRAHDRAFVLEWRGFVPGMAAGLGALAIDRADGAATLRAAARRWQMPARRIVFADADAAVGEVDAAPRGARAAAGESVREGALAGAAVADRALFAHLMRRFDIGPVARPADDAPVQFVFDVGAWDRSRAIVAPGESGVPSSPHASDGARRWSASDPFELWFSDAAVQANAEATLTLVPASSR